MDRDRLDTLLAENFGGSDRMRRAITRQARDLSDSGRIYTDFDYELTAEVIVDHLEDAPDDHRLAERWNWWIGSLAATNAYYGRFRVRIDDTEDQRR